MNNFQISDVASSGYLPHGFCLAWNPLLLWTVVFSDAAIALAYFSIPVALFYFVRRHQGLKFRSIFLLFGGFILACGATHLIDVVNIWYPIYRYEAAVLALTAGISVATAIMLWPLVPEALSFLKSHENDQQYLQELNRQLGESLEQLDHRRIEAERSERRFRLTVEGAPIGLAMVGLDGRWLKTNQVLCAMLGYSEQELLAKTFQDITHPDDLERDLAHVKDLVAGLADTYRMEKRYFTKAGEIIHIQLDVSILRDAQGQPLHFISQIQDITRRKEIEKELQESKQQLELGYARLKQTNQEITLLSELSNILQACQTVEEIEEPIRRYGVQLFPGYSGALYLLHSSRNYLEVAVQWGNPAFGDLTFAPEACWGLRLGQAHWAGAKDGLACGHVHRPNEGLLAGREALCQPMLAQGEAAGLLFLQSESEEQPDQAALAEARQGLEQLAAMFVDRIGIAAANIKLRQTLRQQSIRDPLTGLFNRRYLEETLPRELALAERAGTPVSVLMLDIDHFKNFNDSYGHEVGDQALRLIGRQLSTLFRGSDIACRYGGEEFAIVLPRTSQADALRKAEELRGQITQLRLNHRRKMELPVTVSIGVASYPEQGDIPGMLIDAADQALYSAKRGGRNQVVSAGRIASSEAA